MTSLTLELSMHEDARDGQMKLRIQYNTFERHDAIDRSVDMSQLREDGRLPREIVAQEFGSMLATLFARSAL